MTHPFSLWYCFCTRNSNLSLLTPRHHVLTCLSLLQSLLKLLKCLTPSTPMTRQMLDGLFYKCYAVLTTKSEGNTTIWNVKVWKWRFGEVT